MKTFTVQCAYARYCSNTVTAEADSLAEALANAIKVANHSSTWSASDDCGDTFIEAVAEGEDVDLWNDERVRPLPVLWHFTEDKGGPHIVVTVEGGVVQHVDITGGNALVEVHDYDTEGTSERGDVRRDGDGNPYLRGLWTNRTEDQDTNADPLPSKTG